MVSRGRSRVRLGGRASPLRVAFGLFDNGTVTEEAFTLALPTFY